MHLGKRAHSDQLWRGWVDDARVYDYVMRQDEVAGLYREVFPGAPICMDPPDGDLNGDCIVNLADFAIWAQGWGWCDLVPESDCPL